MRHEPYAIAHDQHGAGLRDYRPSVEAEEWSMRWMLLGALLVLCFMLGFTVGRHV
jgi:hypothetical protein